MTWSRMHLFALLVFVGCASQIIRMDRTSSGAIERDFDFTAQPGSDHHFISLPTYPFVNCTDTLVYDELVLQTRAALARRPGALAHEFELARDQARKRLQGLEAKATDKDKLTETYDQIDTDPKLERQRAAYDLAKILDGFEPTAVSAAVDAVLKQVKRGAFTVFDTAWISDHDLATALARIQDLASSFEVTPCSSSLRYRNFFGYVAGKEDPQADADVSWIDRSEPEQRAALAGLAHDVGIDPPDHWPVANLSFFHFSDVQIREPGAKLGGAHLSHQLKRLVPSFEQDYVQELYALFVYDGIVRTANAELALAATMSRSQDPRVLRELAARPPPSLMIHTGDSADTGMQSEFDTFLSYTNKLNVPWYQVIGNHDVLAFGNMHMSSVGKKGRTDDESCLGWGRIACTCTAISTLVRAQEYRIPDNRGRSPDALPDPTFAVFPMLLQRICLLHAVAADWFVMDPDKSAEVFNDPVNSFNDPVDSFILSHCKHWHPSPGHLSRVADQATLMACLNDKTEETQPYVHRATSAPCGTIDGDGPTSTMHGFDVRPGFVTNGALVKAPKEDHLGGYYCIQMKAKSDTGPAMWAVILNTNTNDGAYGFISEGQLNWLENLLHVTKDTQIQPDDYVMVFSHHPVYAIYDQVQRMRLTDIVTRSPNVIAYLAGHTHTAGLRTIRPLRDRANAHAKWEIVAPSVVDFPQAVRQVTVKTAGNLGYLEVLTFTPHGTGTDVQKIADALRGAERDLCIDATKCDNDGHALLPGREVTFPRAFFRTPSATRVLDGTAVHYEAERVRRRKAVAMPTAVTSHAANAK